MMPHDAVGNGAAMMGHGGGGIGILGILLSILVVVLIVRIILGIIHRKSFSPLPP